MTYPDAPFSHLQRLTDNVGLLQHADGVVPLHRDGYSVDDVARGLLVVCREPSPSQEFVVLAHRYLYFLARAQALGGKFRNHLGYDRQWRDQPGTEDGWGCALWALGTAAARGPTAGIREESFMRFSRGDAGLFAFGAGNGIRVARRGRDTRLPPRPQRRPRAALPRPCRDRRSRRGRRVALAPPPASDQRPAEVAALADACVRAATVTADDTWLAGVRTCLAWFLGDNDAKVPLIDERTGGCSDGLNGTGRSRNQGAESTLAMIAVLQHGRRMAVAPARAPAGQGDSPAGPGIGTTRDQHQH